MKQFEELTNELQAEKILFEVNSDNKIILYPENNDHECYYQWLKSVAAFNQDYKCLCNKNLLDFNTVVDLHHALVSRRDVQGLKERGFINCSYNVVCLCRDCHTNITKKQALEFLYEIYGENEVMTWYKSIRLKGHFINF